MLMSFVFAGERELATANNNLECLAYEFRTRKATRELVISKCLMTSQNSKGKKIASS